MDWKKLNPWNWFRKEQQSNAGSLTVQPRSQAVDPLMQLHHDMNQLLDSFLRGSGFPSLPGLPEKLPSSGFLRPSVDISENKKEYKIRIEIPGVEKEDIQLTLEDDTLIISGEKDIEKEDEEGGYHCVERSYGSFRRLISLPQDADQEKLEAKFRNGVLTVTLPRREGVESSVKRIAVS
jgi:HSP20 family protein